MSFLATTRRAPWFRGAALLTSAALVVGLLGYALGLRVLWAYLGLFLGALLLAGSLERLWNRGRSPRSSPPRGKLKVLPGGKAGHDLSKDDDPTSKQRWLM